MTMKNLLEQAGYVLNPQSGIWASPDFTGIAYSDGDEVEQRLARLIAATTDRSVLSDELKQHITDWPSLYHLSSSRANILRPFEQRLAGAQVLEIGAGCGAITRYLGECGAQVLALEGSPRRAGIARTRTRDLPAVEVLSESFDQFRCSAQFDVITLIGVLEYANQFVPGANPTLAMLERARAMLKPGGLLLIAIENQLGLKYWAGAPEDHLGIPMYGIEGRYRADQPQTHGRKALADLLAAAGFTHADFLSALPDYKLPVSIVTSSGLNSPDFDAAALASQSAHRDPQLPKQLAFSPELVWPAVMDNGLGVDLANSFLIAASMSGATALDAGVLAYHYSTERMRDFCKQTVFRRAAGGAIGVHCALLAQGDLAAHGPLLALHIPAYTPYFRGRTLASELVQLVSQDGWSMDSVGKFLQRYLQIIATLVSGGQPLPALASAQSLLPGACFDLVPQNIICDPQGVHHPIDLEWTLMPDMPVGWLLFRSLLLLVQSVTRFGAPADTFEMTRRGFLLAAFRSAGFEVNVQTLESFAELESAVQAEVTGRPVKQLTNWWGDSPLPLVVDEAERDRQIASLSQTMAERDRQIASLSQAVVDRDKWLEQYNQQITALKGSHSWQITSPLRVIGKALRKQYTPQRTSMEPGAAPAHKDYPLWRKRISYLTTRYKNGVQRHGLLRSLPLAMRASHRLGSVWMEKQLRRKTYERRLRELRKIIIGHADFIDLFHVPMGWSTPLFQRFQHMSLQAAQLGGLALYGGHLQVDKDLFVFNRVEGNVIVFDALDDRVVQCVFDALSEVRQPKMLRLQSIDLATKISDLEHFIQDGITIVYEYIDEISEEITGAIPAFVIERHKWLLRNEAVFVVATSDRLFAEVNRYRTNQCILSTNGVDLPHWRKIVPHPPADMEPALASGRIIVGYHGALAKWIDYELLKKIAIDGRFELVLIGYAHDDSLELSGILDISNVHFLGSKSYFVLNEYAIFYDIGILPFKRNELTESVSPVKLFEYMAASKPVVTTHLPECVKYKSCLISDTHDDFLKNLATAAVAGGDSAYMAALANDAEKNSWAEKATSVYQLAGIRAVKS